MNYRHAFHAGNFADVFKHVLLTRLLTYLVRKDAALLYLDTHAGSGLYDLGGPQAQRSPEWREGVGRLGGDPPADVGALLAPYTDSIRLIGRLPRLYSGSPLIAQRLLRPHDRLVLCEAHAEDAGALAAATENDRRVRIVAGDGYATLNAIVPPSERRGLVLVDPPYEAKDEAVRLEAALARATRKWPTGVYAVWYPIKAPDEADALTARLAAAAGDKVLRLELWVEPGPRRGRHDAPALVGCGMLIVNPPYVLEAEAGLLLPWLTDRLARAPGAGWRVEAGPFSRSREKVSARSDDG